MNKKLFYFLLIVFTLTSCKKNYKYVEEIEREGILGGMETEQKEEEFKAKSDSAAYLEAYKKFMISKKVSEQMKKSNMKFTSIPKNFRLYNDKGDDITYIPFASKEKGKLEIAKSISQVGNSIINKSNVTTNKIDSSKVKELDKYFTKKVDEFTTDKKILYKPKSAPSYINQNGIYCYFQTINKSPENLRFRIQYYADDWLFIQKIQFSIDGKAYEYVPLEFETDHDSNIWEWSDEQISETDKELLIALSNAKNAKMKFIGRQYYKIKSISKSQIDGIKRTLDLYKAMGGSF